MLSEYRYILDLKNAINCLGEKIKINTRYVRGKRPERVVDLFIKVKKKFLENI